MIKILNHNSHMRLPTCANLDEFKAFCDNLLTGVYFLDGAGTANCVNIGLPKGNYIISIYKVAAGYIIVRAISYDASIPEQFLRKAVGEWATAWTTLSNTL